jgi:hypothetical protein
MKRIYKEFADEFEQLCEKYIAEDFDVQELKEICNSIIDNYGE